MLSINISKYKDSYGSKRNTLKTYCYHLKLYFEYLEQAKLDYLNVNIDSMANFLHWLKNPSEVSIAFI